MNDEFSPGRLSRRKALLIPAAMLLPAALAGCASAPPPPPPPTLDLKVSAGKDQNPDSGGSPAPVAIQIFQLAQSGTFETADVFALTNRTAATLGQDLLATESFVVAAGEMRDVQRALKIGTQFLGVAVLFRDIDHSVWRQVAPVAAHGLTTLNLTTAKLSVTLAPAS